MRAPVNSFEFHTCVRTPQAAYLTRWLRYPGRTPDTQYASFTVRTTRVSNPVCYPHFRASASISPQQAAFAIGVLPDLYAFHRYTRNSACPWTIQEKQSELQVRGWAPVLYSPLASPPTLPLRPVIPNNACTPRITAAAGTKFAGASFQGTFSRARKRVLFPHDSGLHTEMLLPTRGVAASGFPPLCNIPYCCLP